MTLHGRITAREYVDGLDNQVHPMIKRLFPNNDTVFQDSAPIHTAGNVQSWFNITETLWSVLETRMRDRFPPPTSLKQPEDALQEECHRSRKETVQNLYDSIPRRIMAVLKAKGGPTPY
jgi:hypothetical protein